MHTYIHTMPRTVCIALLLLPQPGYSAPNTQRGSRNQTRTFPANCRDRAVDRIMALQRAATSAQHAHRAGSQAQFAAPADATSGFTVKLKAESEEVRPREATILEIPEVLSVRLRQHDPLDRKRQNYPAFKMPDGSVPVLEANVVLHSTEHPDWKEHDHRHSPRDAQEARRRARDRPQFLRRALDNVCRRRTARQRLPLRLSAMAGHEHWKLDARLCKESGALSARPSSPTGSRRRNRDTVAPIQYWTPPGHNTWVGDVATFFHRGRYHVFYLYDRRHHQSKFGKGAHYFEHLSTADFKTWTEHEAPRRSKNNGNASARARRSSSTSSSASAYGWHTDRIYPPEKTTVARAMGTSQEERPHRRRSNGPRRPACPPARPTPSARTASRNSRSRISCSIPARTRASIPIPMANCACSRTLGSSGIWESESPTAAGAASVRTSLPAATAHSFSAGASSITSSAASLSLWSKPADEPDTAYEDVVRRGLRLLRRLECSLDHGNCGWPFPDGGVGFRYRGWGGNLVIRELLQFPDGRIGSKWMEEITPETEKPRTLAAKVAETTTFPADANRS